MDKKESEDAVWSYLTNRLRDLDHYTDAIRKCVRERRTSAHRYHRVDYTSHNELLGCIDAAENCLRAMSLATKQFEEKP